MRRVKRVWPAPIYGLAWAVYFAGIGWLIDPHGRYADRLVGVVAGGATYGILVGFMRRNTFRVNATALTAAQRITVLNMVRGVEHSDDARLNQVATRIARRMVARPGGLRAEVLLYTAVTLLMIVIAVSINPRFWYLVAALVLVAPGAIRWKLRRRAAAWTYLAETRVACREPSGG
jgi:hypothetical protein